MASIVPAPVAQKLAPFEGAAIGPLHARRPHPAPARYAGRGGAGGAGAACRCAAYAAAGARERRGASGAR